VVENIPAVVFAKDAHTGRFVLVNRAGKEFLGVPRSAIIGKTDHEVFAKEEADRFVERDQRALPSRQPQVVEEEPVHAPPEARLRLVFAHRYPSLGGTG
jgi:PAS domain S-box-containing protein